MRVWRVTVPAITGVMQDYLKAVYKLQQGRDAVSTSEIAERLDVSPASATNMIKRLARLRLVAYSRYQGFVLTPAGEKIALEIIRHHRLVELYLAQHLGVPLEHVHAEAERLEHVLSEEVEARMATALGNPVQDPHGDPIPSADGTMRDVRYPKLDTLAPGSRGVVAHVSDESPALLRDRKSTRLNSSHMSISYAVFCLKKKKKNNYATKTLTQFMQY